MWRFHLAELGLGRRAGRRCFVKKLVTRSASVTCSGRLVLEHPLGIVSRDHGVVEADVLRESATARIDLMGRPCRLGASSGPCGKSLASSES